MIGFQSESFVISLGKIIVSFVKLTAPRRQYYLYDKALQYPLDEVYGWLQILENEDVDSEFIRRKLLVINH